MVSNPEGASSTAYIQALHSYFETKKVLHKTDIFCLKVPYLKYSRLKECVPIDSFTHEDDIAYALNFFYVKKLRINDREVEYGAVCAEYSAMKEEGTVKKRLPKSIKKFYSVSSVPGIVTYDNINTRSTSWV